LMLPEKHTCSSCGSNVEKIKQAMHRHQMLWRKQPTNTEKNKAIECEKVGGAALSMLLEKLPVVVMWKK